MINAIMHMRSIQQVSSCTGKPSYVDLGRESGTISRIPSCNITGVKIKLLFVYLRLFSIDEVMYLKLSFQWAYHVFFFFFFFVAIPVAVLRTHCKNRLRFGRWCLSIVILVALSWCPSFFLFFSMAVSGGPTVGQVGLHRMSIREWKCLGWKHRHTAHTRGLADSIEALSDALAILPVH